MSSTTAFDGAVAPERQAQIDAAAQRSRKLLHRRALAGAFLASYIGVAMGWYQQGDAAGWIASIVGAIVLLVIYQFVRGKTADR